MGELSNYINRSAKLSTAILKCPTGKFTLVGSVPRALCHPTPKSLTLGAMSANVYDTEDEVIDALLAIGITRFQLSDCSWYQEGDKP